MALPVERSSVATEADRNAHDVAVGPQAGLDLRDQSLRGTQLALDEHSIVIAVHEVQQSTCVHSHNTS